MEEDIDSLPIKTSDKGVVVSELEYIFECFQNRGYISTKILFYDEWVKVCL